LPTTPTYGLRYQGLSDSPNGATLGKNLALDVEATIAAQVATLVAADAALDTRLDTIEGAWTTWSPTLTNLTLGNGTVIAKRRIVGKTGDFRFKFTLGSTSAVGTNPQFSLPFTLNSEYAAGQLLAIASLDDAGVAMRLGALDVISTTVARLVYVSAGAVTSVTATVPHTWGTGDSLAASGTIEIA